MLQLKRKKKIEDNAIKLIVKISEGSVRDALSLLDRVLVSSDENMLTFKNVQKIFGYTDKSSYIELLNILFNGNEKAVIKHYRNLYHSGVEPNLFLNEFLEILYYIKNISYIENDGTNFSLNDNDYKSIITLSKKLLQKDILLFWEYTIKTIKEISLVSNQNLSIEMFLIQLMYIKNPEQKKNALKDNSNSDDFKSVQSDSKKKTEAISQIKNIKQEEEKQENNINKKLNSIEDLIQICLLKKEMKLKYELENNVNLVSFIKNRIEISFNHNLNKNFVKDLTEKLFQWTNNRWVISFSKEQGQISIKEEQKILKEKNFDRFKNSKEYNDISKDLPDIELIDINKND